jgi:hypothetical protein
MTITTNEIKIVLYKGNKINPNEFYHWNWIKRDFSYYASMNGSTLDNTVGC